MFPRGKSNSNCVISQGVDQLYVRRGCPFRELVVAMMSKGSPSVEGLDQIEAQSAGAVASYCIQENKFD